MIEFNTTCNFCNKSFYKQPYLKKRSVSHFCSRSCYESQRKSTTVELFCSYCEELFIKTRSQFVRATSGHHFCSHRCSTSFLIGKHRAGYCEPNDSNKVRQSIEYRFWRAAVLERDFYTCQKCGDQSGSFNAHHILSFARFPDKRFEVLNGITLCEECHKEFHREYGRIRFTSDDLTEWLEGYLQ